MSFLDHSTELRLIPVFSIYRVKTRKYGFVLVILSKISWLSVIFANKTSNQLHEIFSQMPPSDTIHPTRQWNIAMHLHCTSDTIHPTRQWNIAMHIHRTSDTIHPIRYMIYTSHAITGRTQNDAHAKLFTTYQGHYVCIYTLGPLLHVAILRAMIYAYI